ncbi:arginine--tRNA ligase [Marinicella sp. S1101]|uniref:arginine--tRNA ligase n=1 Tax=Marinicella marina TaxID=2996016 RepID=UPI002260AC9B|nr:arginine--tRNA ligase [Marinicella marina]MCX7552572.1 arginine--tRNA ligase [Marinicella marina]MDJ1139448.1 arginine--tRNA ligase [Marinicella marina]
MIGHIQELIENALEHLQAKGEFNLDQTPTINIERTRSKDHGDYASNVAMMLAKPLKMNPRAIAEKIIAELTDTSHVSKVEIAGPGFINFYLTDACRLQVIKKILKQKHDFGNQELGAEHKITVEFVSANPTGPLHVGHGRGAAFGSSLCNVLKKVGYDVHAEYYVNDHGRQMDILAMSVWLRYLELCGEQITFPVNGYKGEYIVDIARKVRQKFGDDFRHGQVEVFAQVSPDETEGGDKELHVDDLVLNAKDILGKGYAKIFKIALKTILTGIEDDLEEFAVFYDEWFSEKSLHEGDTIERALAILEKGGHLYKKDGALWFNATHFGDEKDRVVMRENGLKTYFASDVAYLLNKFERGFEKSVYVFGADHHGYIPRLKAATKALGFDADKIEILLVQFAHLFKGGEKLKMSTRSGEFVTLRELVDEVGCDAARFFYVMRSHEQHLDFDMDLAKSQSNDNPVYYIQYAHARICSIIRKLEEQNMTHNIEIGHVSLELLVEEQEHDLIKALSQYPEVVEKAAVNFSVHSIANYLRELAQLFHSYYNAHQVQIDNENLRNARLNLCLATRYVLADGLALLGSSAPQEMRAEDKPEL